MEACSPAQEQMVRVALQAAAARLTAGVCGLPGLEDLRFCLLGRLAGSLPLVIRCADCGGVAADGFTPTGNNVIGICHGAFGQGQNRLNAVLFHELVHTCGGEEMDGEALESHCFNGTGSTPPGPGDFRLFEKHPVPGGFYAGRYVLWHPATGQVYVNRPGAFGLPLDVQFRRPY
jgi:hypothetical protein